MEANFKQVIDSLEKKEYAPIYLVDGEESYYLDLISEYFEDKILTEAERDFNLIVLYGKEVAWSDVVNACRRFPMFAERQVVILKDAGQLKGFNELAGYIENPSPTTIFLIENKLKKADGRSKTVKLAKEKGIYFSSEKVKEEHMPAWIQTYGKAIGFTIGIQESQILATYLGNDLQKVVNEIQKVRINVPDEPALTAAMIQKYIGISRDYNIFEFPETLTNGNKDKLYRMLSYFIANPKSAPMPLLIGSFYNHFNGLYKASFLKNASDKEAASALGTFPSRAKGLIATASRYDLQQMEACMLLLGKYSAAAVGIDSAAKDSELLKEMVGKLEAVLG